MRLIFIALLLVCPIFSFGQQLITEASRASEVDTNGDPQNNILDPNSARQGVWYYDSFDGELLLVEHYQDNILLSRQLALETNEVQSLLDESQWAFLDGTSLGVQAATLSFTPQADKQLGVIIDHSGLVKLAFLGNWSPAEVTQTSSVAEQWFATHGITFNQNYTYALILVQ